MDLGPITSVGVGLVLLAATLVILSERHLLGGTVKVLQSAVGGESRRGADGTEVDDGGRWIAGRISSEAELTEALESIVSDVYRELGADAVELSLKDAALGGVHSSIAVGNIIPETLPPGVLGADGNPPPKPAPKTISLTQDLIFAGESLGQLVARFSKGREITDLERIALRAVALRGVMVLVNARYTQEIVKMRKESDHNINIRTGFLGNLSHELRGPLGIILNASELVLEGLCGPLTADQEETLNMVRTSSEHLMELITDVLDYAKIESGKMVPTPATIALNEQLPELMKMVRTQADSKKHTMKWRETAENLEITCDRRHFRQVMLNLLTNAVKYTPDGGSIEVWAEQGGPGRVRVCVRDSGVGISPTDRSKVFAAFERLDHEYSRAQVGTGLGLSLIQKLVTHNRGTIDFDSELGQGSTFWVELPQTNPASDARHIEQLTSPVPRGVGEHILMVSPGDEERVLVSRYLRNLNYIVLVAENERDARSILRSKPIGVVILTDSFVPEHGQPLASFVRDEQHSGYIPVILLTRHAFLVDVERYLREDVDRCLPKPIRLEELGRACGQAMDAAGRRVSTFSST